MSFDASLAPRSPEINVHVFAFIVGEGNRPFCGELLTAKWSELVANLERIFIPGVFYRFQMQHVSVRIDAFIPVIDSA